MTKLILGVVLVGAIGCGTDDGSSGDAPSCQQAMAHYYNSGCVFYDTSTNPPAAISVSAAINACSDINSSIPTGSNCRGRFDVWKECLHETPSPVSGDADCDCSQEHDALFACPL